MPLPGFELTSQSSKAAMLPLSLSPRSRGKSLNLFEDSVLFLVLTKLMRLGVTNRIVVVESNLESEFDR